MSPDEVSEVQEWAEERFDSGCLIGDLARSDDLTDDEVNMLVCAREGWLAAEAQAKAKKEKELE